MFRNANPTNELLQGSRCIFIVNALLNKISPSIEFVNGLNEHRGFLSISGEDARTVVLDVPHDQTDAFGGLMLLSSLGVSALRTEQREGSCQGSNEGYCFRHFWRRAEVVRDTRTFTQRFINELLFRLESQELGEQVALPVAMDDLGTIDETSLWGNSLVIVTYSLKELLAHCQLPRDEWNSELKIRAERTIRIIKRRKPRSLSCRLLISSVGCIARLPWAPGLDPSSLMMVPTPIESESANLVVWSNRGIQGMSICCEADHPLLQRWGLVLDAWKATHALSPEVT